MADLEITPGSPEAVAQGCACQPRDGEGIHNPRWPEWLTEGCPLHDPNIDNEAQQPSFGADKITI